MIAKLSLLVSLSLFGLGGCILFEGGEEPCLYEVASNETDSKADAAGIRDPNSGLCTYGGGGGGGGGGGSCGDEWGGDAPGQRAPEFADWAICYGQCESLDETTCLATAACRAAYVDQWGDRSFLECWGTAPSGPIQGGGCSDLDAYQCSRHDDCSVVHGSFEAPGEDGGFSNGLAGFQECIPEPVEGCYGDQNCSDGTHCNASTVCLPDPSCGGGSGSDGFCEAVCYGFCVPDEVDPGTCFGDISCFAPEPQCPIDTTPGVKDGCWTGYCIPLAQCETPAECATLDEAACVSRAECDAIYEGVNCSCDANSCVCSDWLFDSCELPLDTLPADPV